MILAIEQAIVEALAEAIPALTVEAMPENPGQYAMTSALGAVLVGYQGSSYSEFTSQGGSQDREFHFEVTLLMRDLRTHQGAYAQLETIRETLSGLTFAGCSDSRVSQDEFVGEEDGLWQYSISFLVTAFL